MLVQFLGFTLHQQQTSIAKKQANFSFLFGLVVEVKKASGSK
jgi:hypothetical protein